MSHLPASLFCTSGVSRQKEAAPKQLFLPARLQNHVAVRSLAVLLCRRVKTERASASFGSSTEDVVVPMDSLGEAFDRLANDNRVGSYVKAGAR